MGQYCNNYICVHVVVNKMGVFIIVVVNKMGVFIIVCAVLS